MSEEKVNNEEAQNNKKETPMKFIVLRCAVVAVCVAVACAAMIRSASKHSDALMNTAEDNAMKIIMNQPEKTSEYDAGGESYIVESDDDESENSEANDYDVTTVAYVEPITQKTPATDEMNRVQIVELFNNAVNSAKKDAKSIKQNYAKTTQVGNADISSSFIQTVAEPLIAANTGEDKSRHNKTYTDAKDKNEYFPVSGQTWASRLTADDVKSTKITESDGVYTIKLNLKDDSKANMKAGEGHTAKAVSLVTKEQIIKNTGKAGMRLIEENSIKVTHRNAVVKVTVDKKTGKLKTANYYHEWTLALTTTVFNLDVNISFGTEEDFVINWK